MLGLLEQEEGELGRARECYVKAAELGDTEAMLALGFMAQADGDMSTAEEWWQKAAALGDFQGLFQLGLLEKREKKASGAVPRRAAKKARGPVIVASGVLDGYTFVFTGALSSMTRK